MSVINFLWKRRAAVLISGTAAVVLIFTFGFSSKVDSFSQLTLTTYWDHRKNCTVHQPICNEQCIAIKNVTIENGRIFKFCSLAEMEKENEVLVIRDKGRCEFEMKNLSHSESVVGHDGKFHVVTNFVHYGHGNYKSKLSYSYGILTDDVLHARVMEVVNCIQDNLLHPFIKKVHVLVREREAVSFLKRINFVSGEKMIIQLTDEPVTMKQQLIYASNCLKNEIVAISHQDNKFGHGWEKLKPEILLKKKIMYALTRHTALNITCKGSSLSANCDPGSKYIGSHDTFVFGVTRKFKSSELQIFDSITPNLYGMENVLIWFFKKLGYKVMNPCPLLHVHHHHCVVVREQGRKRVNSASTTGYSSFTDKLE